MLRLHTAQFLRLMSDLSQLEGILVDGLNKPGDSVVIDQEIHKTADALVDITRDLHLSAEKEATRFRAYLQGATSKEIVSFRERIRALRDRISDELEDQALFLVEVADAGLIDPPEALWGSVVRTEFPTAVFEFEEAAKCIALDRATGAVFHLMRCVEIALKAVAAALQLVAPSNDNWGGWLRVIRAKIDSLPHGTEKDYFQDLYQRLDAVKDASRNPCMHVESVYQKDEARHIYALTEHLFRKLAAKQSETRARGP